MYSAAKLRPRIYASRRTLIEGGTELQQISASNERIALCIVPDDRITIDGRVIYWICKRTPPLEKLCMCPSSELSSFEAILIPFQLPQP